ncbi:MAG TPA: CusA/CzcA family heavy metal efflux RND transporter, partial [Cellvibrionaceae bacterium]
PITTGLGQILFYRLEDTTGTYSLTELREIQDWIVKYNLQTVTGVTEVLSIGGEVKQFQVRIQPRALLRYQLSLPEIKTSIEANNANVGAQYLVQNDEEYLLRSVGLARNLEDLQQIVVKTVEGTPVYLHQLGEITVGGDIRRGLALANGQGETVVGMVLKLIGANTSEVITAVKTELDTINASLPEGVVVKPYYDQAQLVKAAVNTVTGALLQGIALVSLVLLVFMGAWRPSLVVALSIPFSVALALMAMKVLGISANLMSLGGLAIAIGMMVDGAVVVVENIDRQLRQTSGHVSLTTLVQEACHAVARPIVFAIVIIIVVFIPLFSLQGVEGATFRPLAYTVSLAMLASLLFALVVAPVMATLIMRGTKTVLTQPVKEAWLTEMLSRGYRPLVAALVAHRWVAVFLALAVLVTGAAIAPRLGSEFVPRFNEGDLLIRATMAPSISLEKARDSMQLFEQRLLAEFPDVTQVVTRVGRGEIGAHADPVNNAEIFVTLKPQSEWQTAHSLDGLYAAMSHAFEDFPGARFNFTQPIAASVDELMTGTKAELSAKLFGDNLSVLEAKATAIAEVLRTIPGASDVQQDQVDGAPQVRITLKREAIARYGLSVDKVQETLRIAVGGATAGQIFEGVRRFDINLRLQAAARDTQAAIKELMIVNDAGQTIPLSELAQVETLVGPRQITRENNQRFISVQTNVRQRDIGSFVAEAQTLIASEVELPPGYFLRWGGQFELQQHANQRLQVVVPITLALVFIMLFATFGSLGNALLILLNIPLALVGGVVALWLSGLSLSVPASVGFIALFGIALENALVLVSYLNRLVENGMAINQACIKAAQARLRPVLITAVTTGLGLTPLLYATGTGSEVQQPLATVVVGGLVSSTLLTLLILPALYPWFIRKK